HEAMRLLQGTRIIEAGTGWRDEIECLTKPVVIDVGCGDGRFVYENARKDPSSIYIGLDPDAEAMAEYAFRAARKPARGGVDNASFVVASVEQLPEELQGLANRICVNFPWTGLLRGIIRPEPSVLEAIASLAGGTARFEIILCYDPEHDIAALEGEALPVLDYAYIDSVLLPAYATAGLQVTGRRRLSRDEALAIASTWGRRLLHGRPRDVFQIRGLIQRRL
ncbi:MAG TPA: class I SAM-dependent methyltransferase, partial [Dehalococcoidia bacterium]|nr:class I SAM-dependent methyltransferase [Dehalococcoidia bacterium]